MVLGKSFEALQQNRSPSLTVNRIKSLLTKNHDKEGIRGCKKSSPQKTALKKSKFFQGKQLFETELILFL